MRIKFIILCLSVLLVGCRDSYPQEYLMEHPEVLKKEIIRCRNNSEYTSYCDHIKQVSEDFTALADVRANDPELFGKQILQAQIDLINTGTTLENQRQELQQFKLKNAPTTDIQAIEKKLLLTEQAYEAQSQKIRQLLAVVAATSMRD